MMIPENEKSAKNHQMQAQKMMASHQKIQSHKEKIEKRRNRIYQLDLQGYTNEEIAKELQVSIPTVERDLHHMRYFCLKWTQDIIASNSKKSMFDSYTRVEIVQKELWNMYRAEKDPKVKRQILNSIVTNAVKQDKIVQGKTFTGYDKEDVLKLEAVLEQEAKSEIEKTSQ